MAKAAPTPVLELPKKFTDVLYLTNRDEMAPEVKQLLKQKKLSFCVFPIDKFSQLLDWLDLIGTVIIDIEDIGVSQQQKLARLIESLEIRNIGAILLSDRQQLPVKSFSLASPQVKSFSLATAMESVSVDELWARISINLAYRKKNAVLVAKPEGSTSQAQKTYNNKLAEQLRLTGTLVDSLAEQLRVAGLVQHDFLPTQLPNTNQVRWATVFLPAEWVSGDIYDIARIDEQHIGFYVADAIGHSVPAALLTIFLKQTLVMRATFENNYRIFSPAEVMTNLNERMAGQKLSGYQFATCCYCMLNVKTLQLTYARAGHPYPILMRPGSEPQQLETRGSLLGVFEKAEFVQQTIQLQPKDKVLLYSDGAEPMIGRLDDQKGFIFSDEFCQVKDLSIVEITDKLNVLARSKKVEPFEVDDITVVGLEIL
jgi:sigma-B regulation protein RsbU (phosphoserine phosphatase)